MTVYIGVAHMREGVNPYPQGTWTYSQAVQATDPDDALTEASAFFGAMMVFHSSTITLEGVGVYSAPKADKLFKFAPLAVDGGVTISGSRWALWNTLYTQFPTAAGRVGFHHWRVGWGAGDITADNEWSGTLVGIANVTCNSYVDNNPGILCKPNGVLYVPITRTDIHPHMRQFGARTPVGGRGASAALRSSQIVNVNQQSAR